MAAIVGYFQERSGVAFPCWEDYGPEALESLLCHEGIRALLGKTRTLYAQLPLHGLDPEQYRLMPLRHFERREQLLELHQALYDDLIPDYAGVDLPHFKEWSLDPRHFFQILLYKDSFLGLLFALRLRPEAFEEIVHFRKHKRQITEEDFAAIDAPASFLILSAFSFHPRILSTLFLKLTTHIILHQRTTRKVGLTTTLADVERMADRMNLRHVNVWKTGGEEIHSYALEIRELLRGEEVLRALFPKKSCPG
jgi:hypothetical protein